MSSAVLRASVYSSLAIVFGVIEWFYPFANLIPRAIVQAIFPYGIAEYLVWILAPIFVALYETSVTTKIRWVSLQTTVFLLIALAGYYLSYLYDVVIRGSNPLLSYLKIGNPGWETASWQFFVNDILPKFLEWSIPAIVLGISIGFGVSKLQFFVRERRRQRTFARSP